MYFRCVSKECATPISAEDYLIVRTHGVVEFTDRQGRFQRKEGPVYLHFLETCLKSYVEGFNYDKLIVQADTNRLLKEEEKEYLQTLGIKF